MRPLYLRLSITDGCAYRCPYCQPDGPAAGTAAKERMTPAEWGRLTGLLAGLGASRVRLTGGEPLSHPECLEIIREIRRSPLVREIALTTNGEALAPLAKDLRRAGLDRINIHVDSLQRERYRQITGRDRLHDVLRGIEAARSAGLEPVKINMVLMRGVNDGELFDFCEVSRGWGVTVRFIELMNTGPAGRFVREHFLAAAEARRHIAQRYKLTLRFEERGASPAREYLLDGGQATVGFIASESEPFCESCNRVRLTATGRLKVCLYDPAGFDTRALLRDPARTDQDLSETLAALLAGKRSHHPAFGETGEGRFSMAQVGG